MRIPYQFPFIGLQLLLLTHIAHTFVLLTANMEDVKKLARKFVSESLAEKIAEFIAKATQEIAPNVSEENELNAAEDEHQVSEENNKYNVERHGVESAAQDIPKSAEDNNLEKPEEEEDEKMAESQPMSIEQNNKVEYDIGEPKQHPDKRDFPVQFEGPSRYVKVDAPKTVKQYAYPLNTPEKNNKPNPRLSDEDENYNAENRQQNKYLEDNYVSTTTTSTFNYADQYIANNPARKKVKGRPYRLLSHLNSIEDNEVTDAPESSNNNNTSDDFSENELFMNQKRSMGNAMTTRKAAYEFDQYDNKNYPKSRFIAATSGSVVLEKVTDDDKAVTDKWWEKELPDEDDARRKSWF